MYPLGRNVFPITKLEFVIRMRGAVIMSTSVKVLKLYYLSRPILSGKDIMDICISIFN